MTPFGALNGFGRSLSEVASELGFSSVAENRTRVYVTPERQVLHGSSTLTVVIEDPEGVPESPNLTITYNGVDMSSQFLARASREYQDPMHRQLRLSTRHLRLVP